MMRISPDIIGPGIEEEYSDALIAIHDVQEALGPQRLTNHTPEGRVSAELMWLKQEIVARRLPIPVDQSYVNTIFHAVASNELGNYPGLTKAIGRLYTVINGTGLLKSRHYPVVVEMIDDFVGDADEVAGPLSDADRKIIADLRVVSGNLKQGRLPDWQPPQRRIGTWSTAALDDGVANGFQRLRAISAVLYEHWRPKIVRKPSLAAPVPGLPERAPSLPRELEGTLT